MVASPETGQLAGYLVKTLAILATEPPLKIFFAEKQFELHAEKIQRCLELI